MTSVAVIGTQWGDEGKGKITDMLAENAECVVRFQGGNNAGHTVVVGSEEFRFHLLPSGILRPDRTVVIGNGVVVDPGVLLNELDKLKQRGIKAARLLISERAHVIFPFHCEQDSIEETAKGSLGAGTTKRGIGPCYSDKTARFGIRMIDLTDEKALSEKLDLLLDLKKKLFSAYNRKIDSSKEELLKNYLDFGKKLKNNITDTSIVINEFLDRGKNVIFEGAQGTHLDIDLGIYPFGTSSNTTAGGACTGSGVSPKKIGHILGVMKAYTTRVGTGPVPTELNDKTGDYLREKGREFGTTTGRPRRCGWLDLVLVRYSHLINCFSSIAVTKLDVLSGLENVSICTVYRYKNKEIRNFPASMRVLSECQPVYKTMNGFNITGNEKKYSELDRNAQDYIGFIENYLGVKVSIVSVGPERTQTIVRERILG